MILTHEQSQDFSLIRSLAEQGTHRSVSQIDRLGGNNSYTYLLNGHTVFKLPSSETAVQSYQRTAQNAPVLQPYLSVKIPQPTFHTLLLGTTAIPALIYEQVPGHTQSQIQFHKTPQRIKEYFLDQLAEKIHEIHSIPSDILPNPPLEVFSYGIQKMCPRNKMLQTVFRKGWHIILGAPSSRNKTLLHADLHSDNVCIDTNNKITGILDLESICVGQPFIAFRPTMYAPQDLKYLSESYIKKYPGEVNQSKLKIFQASYNTFFYLYYLANVIRRKKNNKLDRVQYHHDIMQAFKENQR